ncbi:hypothetical protein NW762_006386 [Fusarium torreyae]|uniref:Uncharacterized protein n=1 Tax=Fusarium torreyae TaxID=1237075 RepID=A0A9W8S2U9_9HYPO|nr:hypothetical protein NW762_006386 [Fusarium torreyae]
MTHGKIDPDEILLDIDHPTTLWAQPSSFEGIQYVGSLSASSEIGKGTEIVTVKHGTLVNIYIAHDLLGVRKVIVTLGYDTSEFEEEPGLYWTAYYRRFMPFRIQGYSDSIKIRSLAIADVTVEVDENLYDFKATQWSVLPTSLDLFSWAPSPSTPHLLEDFTVSAIDWNTPEVQGYSFLVMNHCVYAMIAHKSGERFSYDMSGHKSLRYSWFYIRMDLGERISELWIRQHRWPSNKDPSRQARTLILRTSKELREGGTESRSIVLGNTMSPRDLDQANPIARYQAIVSMPKTGPCRMFYANTQENRTWLGFEQVPTWHGRGVKHDPTLPREEHRPEDCIYTSAELEDVREVTPCRSWKKGRPDAILGLLLTYTNDQRRCVGSVRLDYLDQPILVSSRSMWVGFRVGGNPPLDGNDRSDRSGIEWLGFSWPPPVPNPDLEYLEVPWRGRLDWYVAYLECYLYHYEDSQPRDEMHQVLDRESANQSSLFRPVLATGTFFEHLGTM